MKTVEMRKILREAGEPVPRNNVDVKEAYHAFMENQLETPLIESDEESIKIIAESSSGDGNISKSDIKSAIKLVSSNVYTYVGKGDEPPHRIKFMGIQWFTRGVAVEVKPEILESVSRHDCFRKGKVDMDEFYESDLKEAKKAEDQRFEDQKLQIEAERVNRKA